MTFPPAVYTIWWIGLVVTLAVFVPLGVYCLHCTWKAARSIQRYAHDALVAAGGIAASTRHIPALDSTIATAVEVLGSAGSVEKKLGTIATVLAQRAG
jgi:hypothetical protein